MVTLALAAAAAIGIVIVAILSIKEEFDCFALSQREENNAGFGNLVLRTKHG